jgi:hypothetical protein
MYRLFTILAMFLFLTLPGLSQNKKDILKVKADSISKDSTEYKLIVLDIGFETWLATQPSMNYHSKEFYEVRNRQYVTEWNLRYDQPMKYGGNYETRIDYSPDIDYGIELNYRLYYFFRYFEERNNLKLIFQSRY